MKLLVVLACTVAAVSASAHYAPVAVATASTGTSQSSRTQDAAGNYAFAYNEQHSTGGSSRQESGNGWAAQGSYSLNVGDGRRRTVKYIADGAGFRAAIATNEPGTAALPAAATAISSPYAPPQPVEPLPVPAVAAPAPVALPAAPALELPALPAALPALPAPIAAPEPAPIAQYALPALPALAPAPLAPVVKAVAAVPAVSSYSTSINHVVPAAAPAIAAPALAVPALPAAPLVHAAPIAQYRGWN